jgi:S1-C subfamily serine protease
VLQQFNLVFDYPGERLLLAPNAHYGAGITADRSGLQLRPHSAGGLVKRIAPASAAAESPLEVGDIVTRFDGNPVTSTNIGDLKRVLASGRKSVRLCWRRGDGQHCDDLTLASRFAGNHQVP